MTDEEYQKLPKPHFCCGEKPSVFSDFREGKRFWGIYCSRCGKEMQPFDSRGEAVKAWDTSFEKGET